mmetsp:Transcript_16144/g.26625  ORF Transcript_16144/g.26625 Transcript_16144/m.26625 type:complete len:220 (-) Transcript_16144:161-820(-)
MLNFIGSFTFSASRCTTRLENVLNLKVTGCEHFEDVRSHSSPHSILRSTRLHTTKSTFIRACSPKRTFIRDIQCQIVEPPKHPLDKIRTTVEGARQQFLTFVATAADAAVLPEQPSIALDEALSASQDMPQLLQDVSQLPTDIFHSLMELSFFLLTVRVVVSWIPTLEQSDKLNWLKSVTDPYLNMLEGHIPSIGGVHLSPVLTFLAFQVVFFQLGGLH